MLSLKVLMMLSFKLDISHPVRWTLPSKRCSQKAVNVFGKAVAIGFQVLSLEWINQKTIKFRDRTLDIRS